MTASGISTSVSSSSHHRSSTFSPVTSPPTDTRTAYNSVAASRSNSVVSTPASTAASPSASTGASTPISSGPTNAAHAPPHHQLPAIRPNAAPPTISARPPQPINKMSMASVISPSPTEAPKMSMTTKEWVIPPRPKPGRKPATDTPPTKRKAQNRAAQRAFRERRAARVGELEEQLEEQHEAYEKTEKELKDKVHSLEMDLQSFKSRCLVLENLLEREREAHVKAKTELEGQKNRWSEHNAPPRRLPSPNRRESQITHHESPTPSVGYSNQPFSISQIVSPEDSTQVGESPAPFGCGSCGPSGSCACADEVLTETVTGCGRCTLGGRCECLEETIKSAIMSNLKRAPSPSAMTSEKRARTKPPPAEETEIDFTAMFSKKGPVQQADFAIVQPQPLPPVALKDSCGFCKDGTYCICADTSMELGPPATTPYGPPPAYSQQQIQTPPPSENDADPPPMEIDSDGAVKLRPRPQTALPAAPTSRGCGPKGPGSCAQCLADPKSGLFCRALSANFERQGGGSGGGCCGGGGSGGGCCKSEPAPPRLPSKAKLGLSLSCAEAYQTLSSHRNFEKAADDIGSWLPKLRAAPKPGQTLPSPSRLPIEVEAASIMSVLKDFDIRFGRGQ